MPHKFELRKNDGYLAFFSLLFSFRVLAGFFLVSFLVLFSFAMILPLNLSSTGGFRIPSRRHDNILSAIISSNRKFPVNDNLAFY